MVWLKVFPLFLIHKAEGAGCLLKYGFGVLNGGIPVDGQSSHHLDFSGCEKLCDTMVTGLLKKFVDVKTLNYRRSVLSLYLSQITAHCIKM